MSRVRKVTLVPVVFQELPANRVHKEQPVQLVQKEPWVLRVLQVLLVLQVLQVVSEHKEQKGSKEQLEQQDLQVNQDSRV